MVTFPFNFVIYILPKKMGGGRNSVIILHSIKNFAARKSGEASPPPPIPDHYWNIYIKKKIREETVSLDGSTIFPDLYVIGFHLPALSCIFYVFFFNKEID